MAMESPHQGLSDATPRLLGSPVKVDKVAVANKHPGVFVVTAELEAETGKRLPAEIKLKEVVTPLGKKDSSRISSPAGRKEEDERETLEKQTVREETPRNVTRSQKPEELRLRAGKELKMTAKEGEMQDVKEDEEKKRTRRKKSSEEEKEMEVEEEEETTKEDKEKKVEDKGSASSSEETVSEVEIAHGGGTDEDSKHQVIKRVMNTRRSRKLLAEQDQQMEPESPSEIQPQLIEEVSEAESEELPGEDVESVGSDSTLTTRSRTRRKDQPPIPGRMRTKGGVKSKLGVATNAKGKGRRIIFKKSATKAPVAVARTVTSDRIYYKGKFFTRGDIVSLVDIEGGIYYAQLRGFMTDQYCEKSGVITWLLPTTNSPKPEDGFDASTYIIGPEEELPRKLDYFTFVMHVPDDYFCYRNAPYPTKSHKSDQEYLLTRAGPKIRLMKDGKAIYKDLEGKIE